MEDGWYVIRPNTQCFHTPFLSRPCAEIRVSIDLEAAASFPPMEACTLTVELVKGERVLLTHRECVSSDRRSKTCLRLKSLPLLWLSGPGDRFDFRLEGGGWILSAALSSKPAKSKDNKRKVITKTTLRPECEFRLWSKFGFRPPPDDPEQKTLPVLDLALAGRLFAIKNAATSNVLEWLPHPPSGLVMDLPEVVTRSPHYRREQLWRVAAMEPAEEEGVLEVILVNADADFILHLDLRQIGDGFYSLCPAGRSEVLDECVPEGYREGCHGIKLSREASPLISKQLWLLELPHRNLLAFLCGTGLLSGECAPEVFKTPAGRALSNPSLVRELALF